MNYAIGTFLFNYFELGILLYSLVHFDFWQAVCVAVFFKFGKLMSEIFKCDNIKIIALILFISTGILGIYNENLIIVCIMSIFIESALIWSRQVFKNREKTGKKHKVFSRVLGFILAPFFSVWLFFTVAFWWFFSSWKTKGGWIVYRRVIPLFNERDNLYYLILFFHHIHYFMYCYMIPYLLIVKIGIPYLWTGILFFIGWGAYNLYDGKVQPNPKYIAWGHVISNIGIIIIWTFQMNIYAVMFGWFLTGLGGGTFYMIKFNLPKESDGELIELYAQLLGTILFLGIISFLSFDFTFILAILFAIIVVALSLKVIYQR